MVYRPSISFATRQFVVSDQNADPYVGFEKTEDLPDGWLYDAKRWLGAFDLKLPSLPRAADPSLQGIPPTDFKSGVGSVDDNDLLLSSIEQMSLNNEINWIPILKNGFYHRYDKKYFYYSDNSIVEHVDSANDISGRNVVTLSKEMNDTSPILASTFKRDPTTKTIEYKTKIQQVYSFSGTYVDEVEQETLTFAGETTWANIDDTKKEFLVKHYDDNSTVLYFNNDYVEQIGVTPVVYQDLAACEILGISKIQDNQVFYLENFPVDPDEFKLYICDDTTWPEWTAVESWFEFSNLASTAEKFFLDKDLGIVYLGTAASGIPSLGETLVAQYKVVPRIEYEEANTESEVIATDADTNPVTSFTNQGFLCISHELIETANISLSIDKPIISFSSSNEHGPIYTGTDFAILEAKVTSYSGLPVKNTSVLFTMNPSTNPIGFINGAVKSTSVTTSSGLAYSSYQPPVSAEDLGFNSTIVRSSNNLSYASHKDVILNTSDLSLIGKESEIYTYQILKDDVLQGQVLLDDWVDANVTKPSWANTTAREALWRAEVIVENDLKEWSSIDLNGRKVVLYSIAPGDPTSDSTAPINPATGEKFVYHPDGSKTYVAVPLRPELVEIIPAIDPVTTLADPYAGKCRLIFPATAIVDPDPTNDSNNIGAYWIVSSRIVKFKASCWSPFYNATINSNEISARVALPDYLVGEYIKDNINKVPFGWKLYEDLDNNAAGLNGATFITINPYSGPYPIIGTVGDTGETGDYASAPFRSLKITFDPIPTV